MINCPVCDRRLHAMRDYPYAPICSENCRREAMRRAGMTESPQSPDQTSDESAEQFGDLNATSLYCKTCQKPMPVREKLLLNLPDGDLYGYVCVSCQADLGTRRDIRSG